MAEENPKAEVKQMAKVLVFHYTDKGRLPKLSPEEIEGIKKKLGAEVEKHPDVKFNGTFVDEEGSGICYWEAPNAEVVNEIIKEVLGEPPVDGTAVVKQVL